ncbi:hypothetical protein AVDCRST_MAG94-4462 [uncultured Leptolyngbya sp.]|uniref:Uncharacterized protein n=1 Tax=uncultured Leptolyngbya sp. TaxID=332963 RepID=A0A6J4N1L6_9CYAN|nr:hypothetical protein AVDCRST_MAG94-4462 [uncultured Leptolyngbya sp.]
MPQAMVSGKQTQRKSQERRKKVATQTRLLARTHVCAF